MRSFDTPVAARLIPANDPPSFAVHSSSAILPSRNAKRARRTITCLELPLDIIKLTQIPLLDIEGILKGDNIRFGEGLIAHEISHRSGFDVESIDGFARIDVGSRDGFDSDEMSVFVEYLRS